MQNSHQIISETKQWLHSFVIAHNICPFAKKEDDSNSIHYEVVSQKETEKQLFALIEACKQLDATSDKETTLLIYPHSLATFDAYLDFLDLANQLMQQQGYEGIYQLASFHPEYQFHGSAKNDPSNYTNRSPYPMLHIIREASLEKVLSHYPNPEKIPERNIQYTQELGERYLNALLLACYQR